MRALNAPTIHFSIFKIGNIFRTPKEVFFLIPKILLFLVTLCGLIAIPFFIINRGVDMASSLSFLSVFYCDCLAIISFFSLYFEAELLNDVTGTIAQPLTSAVSFPDFTKYTTCRIAIILAVINLIHALTPGISSGLSLFLFTFFYQSTFSPCMD